MSVDNLDDLAKKVKELSPPDRLVLAGELLRAGRSGLALTIAGGVVDDLRLLDVMKQIDAKRDQMAEAENTKEALR